MRFSASFTKPGAWTEIPIDDRNDDQGALGVSRVEAVFRIAKPSCHLGPPGPMGSPVIGVYLYHHIAEHHRGPEQSQARKNRERIAVIRSRSGARSGLYMNNST